jgi:hypothetical protein
MDGYYDLREQSLGAGVQDRVGVHAVFPVKVRDVAGLAEMVRGDGALVGDDNAGAAGGMASERHDD